METAVHHHCLGQISPYTSPPPTNHHLTKAMRLKANLSLKRFSAANINNSNSNSNRFLDSEILCVNTQTNSMATKNNQQHESTTTTTKKVEDEEKEAKQLPPPPPPPPPEKPLPGDCCGSGCVRCVWDVYYEELESYNLLYKSDSDDSKSKPS